tara:strand:- start:426 stop:557 length:132 start_codon:yes stop_codon:yes gene_type:complete
VGGPESEDRIYGIWTGQDVELDNMVYFGILVVECNPYYTSCNQ